AGQGKVRLHQDRKVRVVGPRLATEADAGDAAHIAQPLAVAVVDLCAPCNGRVHVAQLQQPQGRIELAHLAVDTGRDHGDVVDETEVLEVIDVALHVRIARDDRSALEGVEDLGRVKAQHRQIAVRQHAAAGAFDTEGVCGVVDDPQPVLVRDALDGLDVAGVAVAVHGQDGGRGGRDGRLDALRVEVERVRIDVREAGRQPIPAQRVCRCHEGVGRGDDLSLDVQRLQSGDQADG